jgi:hypothetical protein
LYIAVSKARVEPLPHLPVIGSSGNRHSILHRLTIYTKGFNTNWAMAYNGNYLLPVGNSNETAINEYSLTENKAIRKISTNGLPICLHKID